MLHTVLENRFYALIVCAGLALLIGVTAELVEQSIRLWGWLF